MRSWWWLGGLLAVVVYAAVGWSPQSGEYHWAWPALWGDRTLAARIVWELRLPRVLAAALTGAALAVAGATLQALIRNPLADPFLLGISGGASAAVVGVYSIPGLMAQAGYGVVPLAAFGGAQAATALVRGFARGGSGRTSMVALVLAGVVVNAFLGALTTLLLVQLEPVRMRVTTAWLAGTVGYCEWEHIALLGGVVVAGTAFLWWRGRLLDAFALGEDGAAVVGVEVGAVSRQVTWAASLLTGVAVTLSGLVGYVGLLVPHAVRFAWGGTYRRMVWPAAAVGAVAMVVADWVARLGADSGELPVGVVCALVGTPVLLVLLRRYAAAPGDGR